MESTKAPKVLLFATALIMVGLIMIVAGSVNTLPAVPTGETIKALPNGIPAHEDPAEEEPAPSPDGVFFATWYGEDADECMGCSWNDDLGCYDTASGDCFDEERFTAASNAFPLGTILRVSYRSQEVIVEVTDRMYYDDRIDLSKRAFAQLVGLIEGQCDEGPEDVWCDLDAATDALLNVGKVEVEVYHS